MVPPRLGVRGSEVRSGYPEGVKVTPRVAACFRWISRGSRCTVCTERDWLEFGFQLALVEVSFVTSRRYPSHSPEGSFTRPPNGRVGRAGLRRLLTRRIASDTRESLGSDTQRG